MSRRLALLINNSDYQDETLRQLVAPQADAAALAAVLEDPAIGHFDEVNLLSNQSADAAREAIAEFFAGRRRTDLLLLYFTGHGVLDSRGDLFLAAANTRSSRPRANSISASFVVSEMDECASQRQVLILDCCHSGRVRRGMTGKRGTKIDTGGRFEGSGFGRIILTATDEVQYAFEGDVPEGEGARSYFTHYLVEGLREGTADANNSGQITVGEMYEYAHEQLLANKVGHEPMRWIYGQRGKLIIAQNPKRRQTAAAPSPASGVSSEMRLLLVQQYARLLPDSQVADNARQELEKLSQDANPLVARAAVLALDEHKKAGADEKRIRDLIAVLEDSRRPAAERLKAGDALAQLGDPRAGMGAFVHEDGLTLPGIAWGKTVPKGVYQFGDRKFEIAAPYQLSRYPVTYAQFECFVKANDFDDPRWWRDMPDEEAAYGTTYKLRELSEQAFPYANRPRERVSWYQAMSFCQWLNDKLGDGTQINLPHEDQWEVAARFNDGRIYPWGNDFDAARANTYEGENVGQTTPVGMYPSGKQPNLELYDLSGNVWEWCRNKYKDTAMEAPDKSGASRALRGGSWNLKDYDARASSRCNNHPNLP